MQKRWTWEDWNRHMDKPLPQFRCPNCGNEVDRNGGPCIDCLRDRLKYSNECGRCKVKFLSLKDRSQYAMRWKSKGKFIERVVCNKCRALIADTESGESVANYDVRRTQEIKAARAPQRSIDWDAMRQGRKTERMAEIQTASSRVYFPQNEHPALLIGLILSIVVEKNTRQSQRDGKAYTTESLRIAVETDFEYVDDNGKAQSVKVPITVDSAPLLVAIREATRAGKCPFTTAKDKDGKTTLHPKDGQRLCVYTTGSFETKNDKTGETFTNVEKKFYTIDKGEAFSVAPQVRELYKELEPSIESGESFLWCKSSKERIRKFLALQGYAVQAPATLSGDGDDAGSDVGF